MDNYGAVETNSITEEHKRIRAAANETVELADKRLARITRLRLVTDPGFPLFDLSYCYGRLTDGTDVRVRLPQWQFPRKGLTRALVEMCKAEGRYAKGLGLLDPEVVSLFFG